MTNRKRSLTGIARDLGFGYEVNQIVQVTTAQDPRIPLPNASF